MKHGTDYWITLLADRCSSSLSLAGFFRIGWLDIKSLYCQAARFKKGSDKAKSQGAEALFTGCRQHFFWRTFSA